MKSYISRPLCTNKIEPFIGKDLIKVITDQRRICKSYILLQISDIIKEKTPEANEELYGPLSICSEKGGRS